MEETWSLRVTREEKQEQGGQALLTGCLGLSVYVSIGSHPI